MYFTFNNSFDVSFGSVGVNTIGFGTSVNSCFARANKRIFSNVISDNGGRFTA